MCSSPSNGLVLMVFIGSAADQNGSGCVYGRGCSTLQGAKGCKGRLVRRFMTRVIAATFPPKAAPSLRVGSLVGLYVG